MKTNHLKEEAKKFNANLRKEIKVLQSGLTEKGNRNEYIKSLLNKYNN